MDENKQGIYQDILTKYREFILGAKKESLDFKQNLIQKVKQLLNGDPEFRNMFDEFIEEFMTRTMNYKADPKQAMIEDLRSFALGKPLEFDDASLYHLMELYHNNPEFRRMCDDDKLVSDALTYWLDIYQHKLAEDEVFKAQPLLRKLRMFALGKLGILQLEKPVDFDETELNLLAHIYHHHAEFRELCHEEDVSVREALMYWLEEQQRRTLKKNDSR